MPSFSRATAAMRCIFAACAISMSEGILFSLVGIAGDPDSA
jgi:hypothetical protein